jgi:tRNA(Ile2) C34 agmatinyltransferase TiaS
VCTTDASVLAKLSHDGRNGVTDKDRSGRARKVTKKVTLESSEIEFDYGSKHEDVMNMHPNCTKHLPNT